MGENHEPFEITDAETGEVWVLNPDRLVQNTRDFFLRSVRENGMKKPWDKMSEAEQRDEVEHATDRAYDLISGLVSIIAKGNNPVIHAIIDNFQVKDGKTIIKAGGIAEDSVLLALNHAGKKPVKIIVADAEQFDQHHEPAQVDRDEPEIFDGDVNGSDDPHPPAEEDPDDMSDEDADNEDGDDDGTEAEEVRSDQWQGGWRSRMNRYPIDECPFDGRTHEGREWRQGWTDADSSGEAPEINKVVDSGNTGPVTKTPPTRTEPSPDTKSAADDAEAKSESNAKLEDAKAESPGANPGDMKGADAEPPHDPETGEIVEDVDPDNDVTGDNSEETGENLTDPAPESTAPVDSDVEPEDAPTDAIDEVLSEPQEASDAPPAGAPRGISSGEDRGEAEPDEARPPLNDEQRQFEFDRGYKARANGFSPQKNPWSPNDPSHEAWASGYEAKKKEEIEAGEA